MMRRVTMAAGGFLLGVSLLFAQAPIEERIPITDPEELAALGLPRDATNVYQWSKADPTRGRPKAGAVGSNAQAPETWGTAPGYTTVMGYELTNQFTTYYINRYPEKTFCEYSFVDDMPQQSMSQLQFPDGAALGQLQLWAYDADPNYGVTFNLYEFCQAAGFNPATTTLIGSADTFGAVGHYFGFTPLNGYRVNNRDCAYSVRVVWAPLGVFCSGELLQVQKFQVSWIRQVSPPPATATFGDVPTVHPFFQFVEALTKSGITGGCGSGNFCPDQPLTRGQMAVFLAKGLGLAWP